MWTCECTQMYITFRNSFLKERPICAHSLWLHTLKATNLVSARILKMGKSRRIACFVVQNIREQKLDRRRPTIYASVMHAIRPSYFHTVAARIEWIYTKYWLIGNLGSAKNGYNYPRCVYGTSKKNRNEFNLICK